MEPILDLNGNENGKLETHPEAHHDFWACLDFEERTMVENGKQHRQNTHKVIHFPTSQGVSDVSEQANK